MKKITVPLHDYVGDFAENKDEAKKIRVNIIIPPLSLVGPCLTIRKFARTPLAVENLVNFGFRLPSAFDNRPLNFDEFYQRTNQIVFVSATPAEFERTHSKQT